MKPCLRALAIFLLLLVLSWRSVPAFAQPLTDEQTDYQAIAAQQQCPWWGNFLTLALDWWQRLIGGDVPTDIHSVTNAGLPPRSIEADCNSEDSTGMTAAHDATIRKSQVVPTGVPEKRDSWWKFFGWSRPVIFDKGNDSAGDTLVSRLPPGTEQYSAFTPGDRSRAQSNDENVLPWYSGLFQSKDAQLVQGLCKERLTALPPGMCCNENGKLFSCSTPTPTLPPASQPPPGTSPPPGNSNDGSVGSCFYLDEQDPDPTQASNAKANPCSYQKLLPYFGNDVVRAKNASQICFAESGGNEINNNLSCLPANGGGTDYSIGLFQINLLWHCSSDMLRNYSKAGYTGADFGVRDVVVFNGDLPSNPCTFKRPDLLSQCKTAMEDPTNNIRFAALKSADGINWNAWSTAPECGLMDWVPGGGGGSGGGGGAGATAGDHVYYSQQDPRFGNVGFGSCTVKAAGCLPTTVSMILSSNGVSLDPVRVVSAWTYVFGSALDCSGHIWDGLSVLAKNGFISQNGKQPIYYADKTAYPDGKVADTAFRNDIRNHLRPGCGVIALAKQSTFWHFFWITEVDINGAILVMDPWWGWNPTLGQPYTFPKDQSTLPVSTNYRAAWIACNN